jgi:hypothetical protein
MVRVKKTTHRTKKSIHQRNVNAAITSSPFRWVTPGVNVEPVEGASHRSDADLSSARSWGSPGDLPVTDR